MRIVCNVEKLVGQTHSWHVIVLLYVLYVVAAVLNSKLLTYMFSFQKFRFTNLLYTTRKVLKSLNTIVLTH